MQRSRGRIEVRHPMRRLGVFALYATAMASMSSQAFAAPAGTPMQSAPTPSSIDDGEEDSWSQKISEKMKDSIGAATARMGLNKPPGPAPSEAPSGCPTIALLPGTESQRVMAPGATGNQGLRYQYSLQSVGRECTISGDRVSIKVGADGRVLLGPVGAAGRFDVPIRVAVFSESQGKPVESRLFRMGVSVPAGQASVPFQFVSESVVVRIPPGRTGEYSIKVGIDGGGKADAGAKVKRASRKRKGAAAEETAAAQ